jgi:hypothetical protein
MRRILRLLSVLIVLLLVCEAAQSALASTITIGETTVLSAADSGNANLLATQNATLSQPATIESLSFYVTQASGNLILGIYDASGPNGGPGALKAQTNSFTPVVGWNTANVITPVSLPAGTYWLAYLPSSNSLAFMKGQTSGVSIRYYPYAFGAMPATFSTSPGSDPSHWSFYATLNPAPTISSVSLSKRTFTAGAPSGTVVGAISVTMSSGSFTGSLSLSGANASSFKIVGSNLETNGVLPAGSYSINIVATESGASNSPLTQAATITAVSQSISAVSLSNSSFIGSSPSGTVVGTINVTMSPSSPAFSGSLSLSTTQGGCTAANGANNSSFAISGNNLVTNGIVAPGSYAVCILATEASASNSPVGQPKTLSGGSTTVTIGETNVLSAPDSGNGNLLLAQNATLSQRATIESLSFYVTQASGNLVLGIYDASGPNGGPGALKAQTNSFTPVTGWNTANVIAPVSLPAGTYWLTYLPSSSNLTFVKGLTSGISSRYYSYQFGALPAQFSTSPSSDSYHWSLDATLYSGAVSQSISSISLSNVSFIGGSPSGTVVGAINVAMSPSSPAFSGSLSLSTTQGGCTATNGVNNSSFAISGGNLVTNGTVAPGSYAVCTLATQAGATNSPLGRALTITASSQSTASLSANPTTITSGQSSTLTWSSTGATSCTGTNFSTGSGSPKSGSTTVSPAQTTTYTVACTNGTNSASASATVTVSGIQTISSIALSNNSTTTGLSSGTPIGTLSAIMNPVTPAFSYTGTNLHLSTTGTDSGGVCNSTNGAGNGSFQIISGDTLATNGTLTSGSKSICVAASEAGVSAKGQAFTITVRNRIDAAATYCAANGGGDGSSGSPWQAACIQAAINAAANGDTVFLAAGNWELKIANAGVRTGNKSVNLVGAGSGNTFDYLGHPNNGSGGPVGTVTRVYTSGTTAVSGGGYITFGNYDSLGTTTGCAGGNPAPNISHIYFDGSIAQSQTPWGEYGDHSGTINLQSCQNATINDIRVLHVRSSVCPGGCANAQFFVRDSNNFTLLNSVVTDPASGGAYATGVAFQFQEYNTTTLKNNIFYAGLANPIAVDNLSFISNFVFFGCDAIACSVVVPSFGDTGCNTTGCVANGGTAGSFHFFARNNLFQNTSSSDFGGNFGTGGGLNDPNTNGIVNDLQWSGNWMLATEGFLTACQWRIPTYAWTSCLSNSISPGMQVNGFSVTNNSVIGATSANIDFRGNGCPSGGNDVGTGPTCTDGFKNMQCVNCSANQNYLQGPATHYYTDPNSVNATQKNTYCSGSSFSGCNTTGFTTLPTAAFTLSPLAGSTVPFNTATFTAQYGAVKWLGSTSATPPGSGDARWNYLPPISLAATHGNTVYLWVMDSANHISSAASQVVP